MDEVGWRCTRGPIHRRSLRSSCAGPLRWGTVRPGRHPRTRSDPRSSRGSSAQSVGSVSRASSSQPRGTSAPDMAISITTWCAGTTAVSTRWASHQTMTPGSRCAIAGSSGTHFSAQPNRARNHRPELVTGWGQQVVRGPASGRWHAGDDPHLFELAQLVAQHRTRDVARETVGQRVETLRAEQARARARSAGSIGRRGARPPS